MKKNILIEIIAIWFVMLFLYTGISKLMEYNLFKTQIGMSPILSPVAGLIAWLLPLSEFVAAILLFIPRWRPTGMYAALGLMSAFTIYVGALLLWEDHLPCSCGGVISLLSWQGHLIFNSICIGLALLGVLLNRPIRFHLIRFQSTYMKSLLILTLVFGLSACKNNPQKPKTGLEGKSIPSFSLLLSDSTTRLNTANIPSGQPVVLFFFGPYCPYSRAEMADIVTNMKQLKNIRFYAFTNAQFPDMKAFANYFKLQNYSNVVTGIDYTNFFADYFKAPGVPYLAFYDAQKRLKEVHIGQVDISEIKQLALQ